MGDLGSFDRGAFDEAMDLLEVSLGELKGLETVYDYWYELTKNAYGAGPMFCYHVPSEHHPFDWYFESDILNSPADGDPIMAGFNQCMAQGRSWGHDMAVWIRGACEPFIDVDTAVLGDAATRLNDVIAVDVGALLPESDFASSERQGLSLRATLGHFSGRTATGFSIFYNDLYERVQRWSGIAGALAGVYAAHAVLIDRCQTDLLACVQSGAEQADKVVAAWAAAYNNLAPPWDRGFDGGVETLLKITEWVTFGAEVGGLVPGVDEVAEPVAAVSGIASEILGHFSSGDMQNEEHLTSETSTDLCSHVTDAVMERTIYPCQDAMRGLDHGTVKTGDKTLTNGSGDLLREVDKLGKSFTPAYYYDEGKPGPGQFWYDD